MKKTYADQCLERAEKATPSPWFIEGSEVRYDCSPSTTESGLSDCTVQICDVYRISENLDDKLNDRKFIANARTDVPELARRLKIACERLRTRSLSDYKLADELEAPLEEK